MIHDFLSSWGLFQNTYLAGWAMGLLLLKWRHSGGAGSDLHRRGGLPGVGTRYCVGSLAGRHAGAPCPTLVPVRLVLVRHGGGLFRGRGPGYSPRERLRRGKPRGGNRMGVFVFREYFQLDPGSQPTRVGRDPAPGLLEHHRGYGGGRLGVRFPCDNDRLDTRILSPPAFAPFHGPPHGRSPWDADGNLVCCGVRMARVDRGPLHPFRWDALYLRMPGPSCTPGQEAVPRGLVHVRGGPLGVPGGEYSRIRPCESLGFPVSSDDCGASDWGAGAHLDQRLGDPTA